MTEKEKNKVVIRLVKEYRKIYIDMYRKGDIVQVQTIIMMLHDIEKILKEGVIMVDLLITPDSATITFDETELARLLQSLQTRIASTYKIDELKKLIELYEKIEWNMVQMEMHK